MVTQIVTGAGSRPHTKFYYLDSLYLTEKLHLSMKSKERKLRPGLGNSAISRLWMFYRVDLYSSSAFMLVSFV